MKKILTTPIRDEDLEDLNVGDVVYLTGQLVTCRDVAHRRLIELGRELPVDLEGGAIFHAGPIVRQKEDGDYEMVSIGPTTSMRMEKFEKEFIRQTGVKLVVGKGGMGAETAAGCVENKAVHAIFPGGCAVLAATKVEKIEGAEWKDLGMPETLWINKVNEFGPLIISIDTRGNNLIEQNKARFNEKKKPTLERINAQVKFIS
ncbi:L(+)-tartrate dehydratase subunit beta [Noviherbaspirillum sp. 1P10PC]|uniref:L(+)-tartrate dehydratase subunit beta n=1 Tax=Noviherbaspirillum sp. 1P10PC TaxID=3132292 RepID=UPI0039A2CEB2